MDGHDHIHMPEDHMDELYTSSNPLVRYAHNNRLDTICRFLKGRSGLKVLDAGCGEGHLIERLHALSPDNVYTGVDITEVALERARRRCGFAEFHSMNLESLQFADESFDAVTNTEVIEHIHEYHAVLAEFARVLRPGGRLLITFPNEVLWTVARFLLGRRPIKVPDHVNSFTPGRIRSEVGLKLVRQRNLPFNLPFAFSLGSLLEFSKSGAAD